MAEAFPAEYRREVVAVARKREAPLNQIAKDFGISEATPHQLRELKSRNRLLEQEDYILRRAGSYLGRRPSQNDLPAGHIACSRPLYYWGVFPGLVGNWVDGPALKGPERPRRTKTATVPSEGRGFESRLPLSKFGA